MRKTAGFGGMTKIRRFACLKMAFWGLKFLRKGVFPGQEEGDRAPRRRSPKAPGQGAPPWSKTAKGKMGSDLGFCKMEKIRSERKNARNFYSTFSAKNSKYLAQRSGVPAALHLLPFLL
jgi:hypothetical protein